MTAQQKSQVRWVAVIGGLVSALTLAVFVAKAVAAEQVAPVDRRVTTLEAQRAEDKDRLGRMERKLDRIIEHLSGGRKE